MSLLNSENKNDEKYNQNEITSVQSKRFSAI